MICAHSRGVSVVNISRPAQRPQERMSSALSARNSLWEFNITFLHPNSLTTGNTLPIRSERVALPLSQLHPPLDWEIRH